MKIAEIGVKAVEVGKSSLRVRMVVWTEEGNKVERQGKPATVTVTIGSIGSYSAPPKDLNGDGLYEDVNGDGKLTEEDAFALAFNMNSSSIKNSDSLFDFNWDGKISFADAVALIRKLEAG